MLNCLFLGYIVGYLTGTYFLISTGGGEKKKSHLLTIISVVQGVLTNGSLKNESKKKTLEN